MSYNINIYLPVEVKQKIGEKAKSLRLQLGYKRTTLAGKSGVPAPTLKRFEETGDISLSSLLKIANALGCLDGFLNLFPSVTTLTISELEQKEDNSKRKRGRL